MNRINRLLTAIKSGVIFEYVQFKLFKGLQQTSSISYLEKRHGVKYFVPSNLSSDFVRDYLFCIDPCTEILLQPYFNQEKDIFIDVGAFVGKYALQEAMNNAFVKVIAIEPHPISMDIFNKNMKLNNLSNIIGFQAALTSSKDDILLDSQASASSLSPIGQFKVTKIDLELLINGFINPNKVCLFKIDVEGSEENIYYE